MIHENDEWLRSGTYAMLTVWERSCRPACSLAQARPRRCVGTGDAATASGRPPHPRPLLYTRTMSGYGPARTLLRAREDLRTNTIFSFSIKKTLHKEKQQPNRTSANQCTPKKNSRRIENLLLFLDVHWLSLIQFRCCFSLCRVFFIENESSSPSAGSHPLLDITHRMLS